MFYAMQYRMVYIKSEPPPPLPPPLLVSENEIHSPMFLILTKSINFAAVWDRISSQALILEK